MSYCSAMKCRTTQDTRVWWNSRSMEVKSCKHRLPDHYIRPDSETSFNGNPRLSQSKVHWETLCLAFTDVSGTSHNSYKIKYFIFLFIFPGDIDFICDSMVFPDSETETQNEVFGHPSRSSTYKHSTSRYVQFGGNWELSIQVYRNFTFSQSSTYVGACIRPQWERQINLAYNVRAFYSIGCVSIR